MKYTKRNIKRFKGRLILLGYNYTKDGKMYENTLSGLITANTNDHILFKVNKDQPEIFLRYIQITNITILKK